MVTAAPIDRAFTAARDTAIRHILERQAAGLRITEKEMAFIDRHTPAIKKEIGPDDPQPISKVAIRLGISDETIRSWSRNKEHALATYGRRPIMVKYGETRAHHDRYWPMTQIKPDDRTHVNGGSRIDGTSGVDAVGVQLRATPVTDFQNGNGHGEILKRVADAIKSKRDMTPADAQAIVAIEREQRQAKNDAQRREELYTRDEMIASIRVIAEAFAKAVEDYSGEYAADLLRTLGAQYAADVAATYPRAAVELEDHYRAHGNKLIERVRQAEARAGREVNRKGNHAERRTESEAKADPATVLLPIDNSRPVEGSAV